MPYHQQRDVAEILDERGRFPHFAATPNRGARLPSDQYVVLLTQSLVSIRDGAFNWKEEEVLQIQ